MSLRARHAAVTSLATTFRFLVVTVGGTHLGLSADRVQGLLTIDEAGSSGEVTFQGIRYARLDVATQLQLSVDVDGPETRCVLVSSGTARACICVDQVQGLKEIERSMVLPLPGHFQGEERTWYEGLALFDDSVALVLNSAWLMRGCDTDQVLGLVEPHAQYPQLTPVRRALAEGQM